ncbi:MAG: hypothetical protein KGZ43_01110 [Sulfuritalea sp.]|nr:hypothetical protein [Sulfuritalea sp.]
MNASSLLEHERRHLAELLEAVQRCVYFLDAADSSLTWPLEPATLERFKKDKTLFGALAAINERFAKLQDTLGASMRHALVLLGEPADTFLKILAFYEKVGVIGSIDEWQTCRAARNLAAHTYETDYAAIAEHFNTVHLMRSMLYRAAGKFVTYCQTELDIQPGSKDFTPEFTAVIQRAGQDDT